MKSRFQTMNELIIQAYTIWLEQNRKDVENLDDQFDYRELCEWFGKEAGIVIKHEYEN